jgi:hypothetical protein
MLLYSLFNSMSHSLLALSGIPFAVAGGILERASTATSSARRTDARQHARLRWRRSPKAGAEARHH